MCLRFVFLLIMRTATWLRLSRREETWRIAEILIPRHQLAMLQRRQPCCPDLNWADRALLAILLGVIPKAQRQGLRLLVTPDIMLRWHRAIVRRRWAARSMPGKTGRPAGGLACAHGRGPRGGKAAGRPGQGGHHERRVRSGYRHGPGAGADSPAPVRLNVAGCWR
jgi:hypothetical protein